MPLAETSEFFSNGSLATLGGCTLATIVVGNAFSTLLRRDWKVVPFLVALGLCFALAYQAGALGSVLDGIVAFVNGCLVFCTAAGVQVTALITKSGQETSRQRMQAARNLRRPWLSSWVTDAATVATQEHDTD